MQYPAQLLCAAQRRVGVAVELGGALLEKSDPAKGPLKEYRMRRMNGAE